MGIFIAYGPHIKPGIRGEISIYDIAPTILYLQDHPVFQDMDGKVLIDIFKDEYVSRHPVRQIEPPDIKSHEPMQKLDEEERHKVEERLRGLGYIEWPFLSVEGYLPKFNIQNIMMLIKEGFYPLFLFFFLTFSNMHISISNRYPPEVY